MKSSPEMISLAAAVAKVQTTLLEACKESEGRPSEETLRIRKAHGLVQAAAFELRDGKPLRKKAE